MGEMMPQLDLFLYQVEPPLPGRNGLHLVELLAKGSPWRSPMSQAIAKAVICPSKTDGQSLLLKTALTRHLEHGEVKLGESSKFGIPN